MEREEAIEIVEETLEVTDHSVEEFMAGMALIGSVIVGPNIKKISKWAKLPRKIVAKFSRNLRDNEVWVGGKVYCDWTDEEAGGIAFIMDCMVATGLLEKRYVEENK